MNTTTAQVTALADQVEKLCLEIQNRRNHNGDWSADVRALETALTRLEKLAPSDLMEATREAARTWFEYGQCGPDCLGCAARSYRKSDGKRPLTRS